MKKELVACKLGPQKVKQYWLIAKMFGFEGAGSCGWNWEYLVFDNKLINACNDTYINNKPIGETHQLVSEKELIDYIVTGKLPPKPEPPKLYFEDLKIGDKFEYYPNSGDIMLKCRNAVTRTDGYVYIKSDKLTAYKYFEPTNNPEVTLITS